MAVGGGLLASSPDHEAGDVPTPAAGSSKKTSDMATLTQRPTTGSGLVPGKVWACEQSIVNTDLGLGNVADSVCVFVSVRVCVCEISGLLFSTIHTATQASTHCWVQPYTLLKSYPLHTTVLPAAMRLGE